jgi:hypothetical protein
MLLKKVLVSFEVILEVFASDVIMMNGGVILMRVDILLCLGNALLVTLRAMSEELLSPHRPIYKYYYYPSAN